MGYESSRSLDHAYPELSKRWLWVIKRWGQLYTDPLPLISWTFRSEADQNRMALSGASQVWFPNSTHNVLNMRKPDPRESWALDFYWLSKDKTKAIYPDEWIDRVCDLAEQAGLFSGRQWGWDRAHVALVQYKSQVLPSAIENLKPLPIDLPSVILPPEQRDTVVIQLPGMKMIYRGTCFTRLTGNKLDIRYDATPKVEYEKSI